MYLRTTDLCVMHLGCKFNYEVPIARKLVLLLTNVWILVLVNTTAMQCLIVAQDVSMYVQLYVLRCMVIGSQVSGQSRTGLARSRTTLPADCPP